MFIDIHALRFVKYLENSFDKYPRVKKNINDEIDAPIPKYILFKKIKSLEKFPRKNTVSE